MGYWIATQFESPNTDWNKCGFTPPEEEGTVEDQTTTTEQDCGEDTITITWTWKLGLRPDSPTKSTDPCPNRCGDCVLFHSNWDCCESPGDWWDITGDVTFINETPLEHIGRPHNNQSIWQWSEANKKWTLLENNCDAVEGGCPCAPEQPAQDGEEDEEIMYVDCQSPKRIRISSNGKMLCNWGWDKTNHLWAVCECGNWQTGDELRIYFDGANQYAYFTFGEPIPDGPDPVYPQFKPTTYSSYEGEIGVFNGTSRLGHKTKYLCESSNSWFAVWLRPSEIEGKDQIVASAVCGGPSAYINNTGYGPDTIRDVAAIYTDEPTEHQMGIGMGQSSGTWIDRFSILESARSWVQDDNAQRKALTSDNPCYRKQEGVNDQLNDPYYECPAYGGDKVECKDWIPPKTITIETAGIMADWYIRHPGPGAPCTTCAEAKWEHCSYDCRDDACDELIYEGCPAGAVGALNGTFVLDRNDVDTGAGGYDEYVYEGSTSCGDFTITATIIGRTVYVNMWSRWTPIYRSDYNGSLGVITGNHVIPGTGRMDCLETGDLLGTEIMMNGYLVWFADSDVNFYSGWHCVVDPDQIWTIVGVSYD